MNNFSLEEEQTESNYSRKLNLSFTDTAIDKVASVLGGYVPLTPSPKTREVAQPQQRLVLPFSPTTMENEQSEEQEDLNGEVVEAISQDVTNDKSPLDYFEKDGQGFLMSKNPDYRGKDKKTQQERFILLYVWAYNAIFQEPVPSKKHLSSAAKKKWNI
ncbi:hypothetical protein HJG54_22985 [Leptolyngbya sp. NK1-12]|uniref:Uncharacterized protein n=1 Tax=Leptolyngbya sp. NK1-12 TaxID=2547451 RepID=A0AA96WHW0_9CYAN|nr:hypothetical protein [Leptolyngbya sp. NK1-12]WNZ25435.1 hypothetical protein HJG54_22985 [Leptolyngbya sp. NK1-12]